MKCPRVFSHVFYMCFVANVPSCAGTGIGHRQHQHLHVGHIAKGHVEQMPCTCHVEFAGDHQQIHRVDVLNNGDNPCAKHVKI